ncbi:chitin binding protein [Venturia nashicola]|uniref:Chitin binding protein n=1 Tax=Venturia nashicola TaxID=86259 RepID=A0A4Z1PJG4_9PEZI|nr:chitin binding protein [Venturia nashicola]TLD38023.1 chitin binding protein [Venturia nashicola]
MRSSILAAAAAFTATVSAHGAVTSPPVRNPGPAMMAACGAPAVAAAVADPTTPLEDIDMSAATADCKLDLCRGATYADNTANLQTYTPGQTINMKAILPIPHEGPMNVSIIDTATNTAIGQPLIVFDSYADENLAELPANNTDFSFQMPMQLEAGQCVQAGQCTMQWFWVGTKAMQTYESCVDFVMAPAGLGKRGVGKRFVS